MFPVHKIHVSSLAQKSALCLFWHIQISIPAQDLQEIEDHVLERDASELGDAMGAIKN